MLARLGDQALIFKMSSATSAGRQSTKAFLVILAFVLAVISLARPMAGTKIEIMKRKGIDIVVALDLSTSMLAQDIKPNRIKRAKYEIGKLVDKLKGDRVGIVAFAGNAFVQCPVTTDYGALKMFLDILDPTAIAAQGTAIGSAIKKARECFDQNTNKFKVIVLITDGEDNADDPEGEAKKAAEEGIIIYSLGIGTKGGVPIPIGHTAGGVVYKKDRSGNTVLTVLNESLLEDLADLTNGKYFHSTGSGLELDRIYREINKLEKRELKTKRFNRQKEQYMWPLSAALLLLLTEYFLSSRRKKKLRWDGRFA